MAGSSPWRAKLISNVEDFSDILEVTISVDDSHEDRTISVEYSVNDGGWGYARLKNTNIEAGLNPPFFISTDGYIYIASEVSNPFNLKIESVEVDVSDDFARAVRKAFAL